MIPKSHRFRTMLILWLACIFGAVYTYIAGALVYGMFSWSGGVFFAFMVDYYLTHRKTSRAPDPRA